MYTALPVAKSSLTHDPKLLDDIPLTLAKQCDTRLKALSTFLWWGDDPDNIGCGGDADRLARGELICDPSDPHYNAYLLPVLVADAEQARTRYTMAATS